MTLRIVVADDHRLVREGIAHLLGRAADVDVVGQATGGVEALELARRLKPEVLVLDVSMEGLNGLQVLDALEKRAGPAVLMLSMHEDATLVERALALGAGGYISKQASPAEMTAAVHAVAEGETYLCARTRALLAHR